MSYQNSCTLLLTCVNITFQHSLQFLPAALYGHTCWTKALNLWTQVCKIKHLQPASTNICGRVSYSLRRKSSSVILCVTFHTLLCNIIIFKKCVCKSDTNLFTDLQQTLVSDPDVCRRVCGLLFVIKLRRFTMKHKITVSQIHKVQSGLDHMPGHLERHLLVYLMYSSSHVDASTEFLFSSALWWQRNKSCRFGPQKA